MNSGADTPNDAFRMPLLPLPGLNLEGVITADRLRLSIIGYLDFIQGLTDRLTVIVRQLFDDLSTMPEPRLDDPNDPVLNQRREAQSLANTQVADELTMVAFLLGSCAGAIDQLPPEDQPRFQSLRHTSQTFHGALMRWSNETYETPNFVPFSPRNQAAIALATQHVPLLMAAMRPLGEQV